MVYWNSYYFDTPLRVKKPNEIKKYAKGGAVCDSKESQGKLKRDGYELRQDAYHNMRHIQRDNYEIDQDKAKGVNPARLRSNRDKLERDGAAIYQKRANNKKNLQHFMHGGEADGEESKGNKEEPYLKNITLQPREIKFVRHNAQQPKKPVRPNKFGKNIDSQVRENIYKGDIRKKRPDFLPFSGTSHHIETGHERPAEKESKLVNQQKREYRGKLEERNPAKKEFTPFSGQGQMISPPMNRGMMREGRRQDQPNQQGNVPNNYGIADRPREGRGRGNPDNQQRQNRRG